MRLDGACGLCFALYIVEPRVVILTLVAGEYSYGSEIIFWYSIAVHDGQALGRQSASEDQDR